jgi:hypothetical protein
LSLLRPVGVLVVVVVLTMAISVVVAVAESIAVCIAQVVFHRRMTELFVVIGIRGAPIAHVFGCGLHAVLMALLASVSSLVVVVIALEGRGRTRQRLGMSVTAERQWKCENSKKHGDLSSH